jgi:EAL domain-containing protein (putative c-di-GMP-specific phosphodiesterase class I)
MGFIHSVDMVSHQFEQPNLKETVRNAMAMAQIRPKNLFLEITESTLMNDSDSSAKTLSNLKIFDEGVETNEQRRFLCQKWRDWIQGFLFSPPVLENENPGLVEKYGLTF